MELLAVIKAFLVAGNDMVLAFNRAVADHFGRTIQVAIDWVLLGLMLVLALRLVRFTFDVLRYVLLPSVVVSGLVAAVTTISFTSVMPLAMGVGTVFLLFKS